MRPDISAALSRIRSHLLGLVHADRFTRFLSVGALGALVDNGVLFFLVNGIGLSLVPSSLAAKELSITVMFVINDFWTFADFGESTLRSRLKRYVTSNIVRAAGALVGTAVLYIVTTHFDTWYILANIIGIGAGFVFNYVLESLATWRTSTRR
ncbi:GtrA family protein [Salarchaeum japonicum]|uniref:GtrA family protein n=1 Tax=Salarchaeum japonicum TaxID=555573 RepID=UPI003C75DB23